MRYLITGGAGFIGSHLAEELLRRQERVCAIDDLSTGSMENIAHLKVARNFEYVVDTILNRSLLAELIDSCDLVFHLAAAVGVRLVVESPVRTIEINLKGTEMVLELASKKKKPVVLASTSEVYGKATKSPYQEGDDLVLGSTQRGRWSYACSKAIDEFLALAYFREKGLPVIIVRLFNTVGPRQTGRYGMVIPTFVRQALLEEPITVYGDGRQSRCFTWVGDVVRALIELTQYPQAVGEVFNIGGGEEITIEGLAQRVKELTESSSEIAYVPYEEAYGEGFEDMRRRVPDISKIVALTGYQPTRGIGDILQAVIDHFQGRMEEERYGSRSRRGGRTAPGLNPGQGLVAGGKARLFEG